MTKSITTICLAILYSSLQLSASTDRLDRTDSIGISTKLQDSLCRIPASRHIIQSTIGTSLPMVALALPYSLSNNAVKDIRNSYIPQFRNRYDDYLQFAPLALQIGMHLSSVKGHSRRHSEIFLADALAVGIMMAVVTPSKRLFAVERPDGSARNSFPSGHTAMAFTSATLLHLEYGQRYPWLSLLGYTMASGVAIGRIANNRHWLGDVMVGAGVGIVSGEIGYWLSGLIHKRPCLYHAPRIYFPHTDFRVYFPWSMGTDGSGSTKSRAMGAGLRWAYDSKGYLLQLEAMLEGYTPLIGDQETFVRKSYLRLAWGRNYRFGSLNWLSLDATVGVGSDTSRELYPSLRLTPRIRLSERLSWQSYLSYELRSSTSQAYLGARSVSFSIPRWRIGSALELRL